MLIGADGPEDYNLQAGENSNKNMTHTQRVDQEVILYLIHITRARLVWKRKNKLLWKRTGSLPSVR